MKHSKLGKSRRQNRAYGSNVPAYALGGNVYSDTSATQAGIQAVGDINPIIGGIAAVGESIVGPIEQQAKRVNQKTGEFKNFGAAQRADVVRSTFDPYTTGMRTLQDPDASTGEKILSFTGLGGLTSKSRLKREEDRRKREIEKKQLARLGQQRIGALQPQQTYSGVYANGGTIPTNDIEGIGAVVTPRYEPISARTAYLEGKKSGLLPGNLLYKDFSKKQSDYVDSFKDPNNTYRVSVGGDGKVTYTKKFERTQVNPDDARRFKDKGIDIQKFPGGGEVPFVPQTKFEEYVGQPQVSQDYKYNFPGLQMVSAMNNDPNMQFKPQYHTERDSAYFYPILKPLEEYVSKRGSLGLTDLENKHINSIVNVASRPSYFMKRRGQDALPEDIPAGVESLQALVGAASDEELQQILNTDFTKLKGKKLGEKVKIAKSLVPAEARNWDIIKAGAYLGGGGPESDFGSLIDLADYQVNKLGLREDGGNGNGEENASLACGGKIKRKMPMGGLIPYDNVPVEVEGGETAVTPDGTNVQFEGPSHAQGGIPTELPSGTDVYSDRIKVPGTKQTFSDANKKILKNIKKFEDTLEDPYSTPLAKSTAERMLGKLEGEQKSLFVDQERLKLEKGNYMSTKKKYAEGGTVTPEDIEKLIRKSGSSLFESYKGIKQGNNPGNTRKQIEDRTNQLIERFRADKDLLNDPVRLNNLYNSLRANPGIARMTGAPRLIGRTNIEGSANVPTFEEFMGITPEAPQLDTLGEAGIQAQFDTTGRTAAPQGTPRGIVRPTVPSYDVSTYRGDTYADMFQYNNEPSPASTPTVAQGSTSPAVLQESYRMPDYTVDAGNILPQGPLTGTTSIGEGISVDTGDYTTAQAGISGETINPTSNVTVDQGDFEDAQDGIAGNTITPAGGLQGSRFGNIASAAFKMAPALYNIARGAFGQADTVEPELNYAGTEAARQLRNRRYNIDPQLRATERAFSTAREGVRGASRTRGELLPAYGSLALAESQAKSGLYGQKQNIENQYIADAAQMAATVGAQDAAARAAAEQYNRQAEGARQNLITTGISQLGAAAQQSMRDRRLARADQMRVNTLSSLYPNLRYDAATGKYVAA